MSGVLVAPEEAGLRDLDDLGSVRVVGWLSGYLALCLVVGAISGVLWWRLVDLPGYVVSPDGGAATDERGLAAFFGSDAWFTLIGAVVGLGLGWVAWRWFERLGWPVALLAVFGSVIAALVCWYVGAQLGPGPLAPRLAVAQAADVVPIELTVHARASVVVWPFLASIPILLASALGPDYEEPRPLFPRRRNRADR